MSRKYKTYNSVPTNVLANRLEQLSDAVCKGPDEMSREFTRRIPAELDRDADLVLSQSARRMTELEAKLVSLREQLAKAQEPLSLIVSSYGDGWYDGFIKAKEINQHSDYNEIGDCDYNGSVILRMSEYAESEYAKILIIKGRLD